MATDEGPAAPLATTPRTGLLTAPYAGAYNWGDTTRAQAGGTLLVYPDSDSTVLLSLDVSNGPPAFHLGQLYQRVVVRRGVGHCALRSEEDRSDCRLRLAFRPRQWWLAPSRATQNAGLARAYRPTKPLAAPAPPCRNSLWMAKAGR